MNPRQKISPSISTGTHGSSSSKTGSGISGARGEVPQAARSARAKRRATERTDFMIWASELDEVTRQRTGTH